MKYIREYLEIIKKEPFTMCKEQKKFATFIEYVLETEKDNLYIDEKKVEKYMSYIKYFEFDLFPWEKCLLVLCLCLYTKDCNLPRFDTSFILVGRGAGKNAFISFLTFCLLTETNGIHNYNIDIIANSESQATTSFNDVYNVLTKPSVKTKMKRNFYWNKECITNLRTKSQLRYKTSNAKSADGLRPGAIIFDEIHEYANFDLLNVHTTGLGKVKDPRIFYITTNGYVRDSVLDDLLDTSLKILDFQQEDNGMLPFICRLDDMDEVHDEKNWFKANPSLYYRPGLLKQIKKEYINYKKNPYTNSSFMTKRMNLPMAKTKDIEVTTWENILATNKEIPNLEGASCTIGFDYTKVNDFLTVGLLFLKGGVYYWISHSWFCINSRDKDRIKAPLEEWQEKGLLTIVNDIEINPDIPCEWVQEQLTKYNCVKTGIDNFRLALLSKSLKKIGIDASDKEQVKIIRPSDIMKIVPVIDSLFNNHQIVWGDNPLMRWFTNNTKLTDKTLGNYVYDKIEPKSRKTDGFMAFVHAMIAAQDTLEDEDNSELFFMSPLVF